MSNIQQFKDRLVGGGARANLFEVELQFPPALANLVPTEYMSFMIKAAAMPASVIENIDIAYRGRMLKVAGDRTYENWTVTVINDIDMPIRGAMEQWMNYINRAESNTTSSATFNALDYYADLKITQLGRSAGSAGDSYRGKTYLFKGAYPVNISAIEMAYDTNNAIQDFTVEFAYQYWNTANVDGGAQQLLPLNAGR
jgi:hypothetical protein